MNHTVQWLTELRTPVCPDLVSYYVQIDTAAGAYVAAQTVQLGRTSVSWDLAPGEYVESVAAQNADGTVREGRIARPFTVGGPPPVEPPPVGEVAPFPFPVWGDPYVPPVLAPGEVNKELWDRNMIEWGVVHGEFLVTTPPPSTSEALNHVYYDMARCMYQVADYTETPEPWHTYAKAAVRAYRDGYVIPNDGAVPGYWNFTTGLRMDYERTGDGASKDAAILLSQKAAYAPDSTPPEYVASHARSREVAYAILSYINAEALGEAKREIRARYVTQSLDYITQWIGEEWQGGPDQISPFMLAITAQALIEDWQETQDTRCLPALKDLADWMWPLAWHEPTSALMYQINPTSTEGYSGVGAPDLNMIIAPWFAWLWVQTGDESYRDKFDALLYGHKDAYLAGGKQWDQNYWWAFAGMAWRESLV